MTQLAQWLQDQMQASGLKQAQLAVYGGIAQSTISDILRRDHIPRVETLFRLADYFDTDRIEILQIAGYIQRADQMQAGQGLGRRPQPDHRDYLVEELVEAFAQVPDEWKPEVIAQARMFVRLANQPPVHIIGEEAEAAHKEEETGAEEPAPPVKVQAA